MLTDSFVVGFLPFQVVQGVFFSRLIFGLLVEEKRKEEEEG